MMTRNLLEIVAMCGGVLHAAQGTADSVRILIQFHQVLILISESPPICTPK